MVIKDNRKQSRRFRELNIGECFMYGGCLYVVTEDTVLEENVCDNYDDSDVVNALNLESGFLERFDIEVLVAPVNAEITIY